MTEERTIVYVVDDDPATRDALSSLIRSVGFQVATFGSADEFLETDFRDTPGCLVLDIRLPGLSGIDLQRRLTEMGVDLPIIFITGHGDIPLAVQVMKAGAVELLTKPVRDEDLLDAIHQALGRDRVSRRERLEKIELRQRFDSLTRRERQVMHLICDGRLNKQIAAELGISEVTVKLHRANVMRKMKAGSVAGLVGMATKLASKGSQGGTRARRRSAIR
ncbi:MAG: nodW [Bryobacterales bacterium]|nr:nodW [Bryobacterales bacterium]